MSDMIIAYSYLQFSTRPYYQEPLITLRGSANAMIRSIGAALPRPGSCTFRPADANFSSENSSVVWQSTRFGNTSFDPSEDLSKDLLASLAISPFHDDPYIKVMQAYNATSNELPIPLPRAPIAPLTVLPPSPVLPPLPLFDHRDFFLPEEILPPQKRARFLPSSSTDSSALP
ncbi:hypothetical protein Tco_0900772 [Tanacetum coccineum]